MIARRQILMCATANLLAGCGNLDAILDDDKPALTPGQTLAPGTAVVLVGLTGQPGGGTANAFYFASDAWSHRAFKFPGRAGGIVAVPVPVGVKRLKLVELTLQGQPVTVIGTQVFGYKSVNTPSIDIERPGLYYLTTLTVWRDIQQTPDPIPVQLTQFRDEMGRTLAGLEPVNFQWPVR